MPKVRLRDPADASSFLRLIVIFRSNASPSSTLRIFRQSKVTYHHLTIKKKVNIRVIGTGPQLDLRSGLVRIENGWKDYLWEKGELGNILDQDVSYESADNHL